MKIGVSGCLLGTKCNFNGKDLLSTFIKSLENLSDIEFIAFCPEDFAYGTPRPNLRIVGGNGYDVLSGLAKVVDENGQDVTRAQIEGANQFLQRLQAKKVQAAILMDGSPSCGSSVILKEEEWPKGGFKKGVGVTAALLRKHNIKVLSSFDEYSISEFLSVSLENYKINSSLKDLKDSPKFKTLFHVDD